MWTILSFQKNGSTLGYFGLGSALSYLQTPVGGPNPVLYFQIQVTEKYSSAMCYECKGLDFIIWHPLRAVFTGANFPWVISAPYSRHFLPPDQHNYPTRGGGEVIIRWLQWLASFWSLSAELETTICCALTITLGRRDNQRSENGFWQWLNCILGRFGPPGHWSMTNYHSFHGLLLNF